MKRNDILYAKRVLRGMHPLYNLELDLCLPFCDPCFSMARMCGCMGEGGLKAQSEAPAAAAIDKS